MRIPPAAAATGISSNNCNDGRRRSFREGKESGKAHYGNKRYSEALECYRLALAYNPLETDKEKQMVLSNIVACRLKLGTRAELEVALVDAKQCISLNEGWSKGHVRLASVYIELARSNDACNSLQRAITLDPGNQAARNMLTSQLRRERVGINNRTVAEDSDSSSDLDGLQDEPLQPLSCLNILQLVREKLNSWLSTLNDDVKSCFKVCAVLLVLYILLGGRFGLASRGHSRGNYNAGNVYDQFYSSASNPSATSTSSSRTTATSSSTYAYSSPPHDNTIFAGTQYDPTNIFSLLCVFAIVYVAHTYAGVNPFQALWMVNLMHNRRRGGFRPRGMGRGGGAFGGRYPARRNGFRPW